MRWPRSLLACASLALLAVSSPLSSAESRAFIHHKRYAMGTVFEIVIYDDDLVEAAAAARAALDEVVRLDGVMSNYKPESELSRMNRTAHFAPVRISPELYEVIDESLYYSRISGGQFDISVGPVVDLWKAALAGGPLPTSAEQSAALRCVGYQKIELLPPDRIQFHSDCMRLDLGAIGKGYAVDRVVKLLKSRGIRRAYIDAGGSTIYAMGAPPGTNAWKVRLRDPSGKLAPETALLDNSVSTSEQSAPGVLEETAPGHIVLPGTGKPLETHYAVSVRAPSAAASDALSTTLLLLGPAEGAALAKTLHEVSAIWIDSDGDRTMAGDGTSFQVTRGEKQVRPSPASDGAARTAKTGKDFRQ